MQLEGLIYKSTGSWYIVRDDNGVFWNMRIKGKMKIDDEISSTNPIAVGDRVVFDVEDEAVKTGTIKSVMVRNNYIVRVSPHNKHQKHIIASNLDAAVVIVTIAEPRTSSGFIDRFLVTAEAYHIPAVIVVNKCDALKPKHIETLERWRDTYTNAGYELFAVSATHPATLDAFKARIAGKTSLFSGHSGVGKSTLINQLVPDINLRTTEVSGWSGKGQHTTTFAEMFDFGSGRIIDTPGVKEFGIIDFEKQELSHYFPEMRNVLNDCKFNNCIHVNEPGCAVMRGVEEGSISAERYYSYRAILDSI